MNDKPFSVLRSVVAEVYGVTEANMCSRRKDRQYLHPRQMLACAARELLRWKYQDIGVQMGRDHTVVSHSHRQAMLRLESDELAQRRFRQIANEYARRMIMGEAA